MGRERYTDKKKKREGWREKECTEKEENVKKEDTIRRRKENEINGK